jgi:hypothetical protein
LQDTQKESARQLKSGQGDSAKNKLALKLLSEWVKLHTGKQVYLFVDEYDVPMHTAYVHGYYEDCKNFMGSFLGEAFKGNQALAKGLLTGVLKVSQASLFSQFNNPTIDTVLDPEGGYGPYFGFTEAETDALLDAAALPKRAHELKQMYNGYEIGGYTLYNPFSIVSFISAALLNPKRGRTIEDAVKPYWVTTDGRDLIRLIAKSHMTSIAEELRQLLAGASIESEINLDIVFDARMQRSPVMLWSLLLLSGYLKVVGKRQTPYRITLYKLTFPNQEVRDTFQEIILALIVGVRSVSEFSAPIYALVEGKVEKFADFLAEYLLDTPSYFDATQPYAEQFYQGLLLGMCLILENSHIITSNRESGKGRLDVSITTKDRTQKGIILEVKVAKPDEDLKKLAPEAYKQIIEKKYVRQMRKEGIQEIIGVGIAFRQKEAELVWGAV